MLTPENKAASWAMRGVLATATLSCSAPSSEIAQKQEIHQSVDTYGPIGKVNRAMQVRARIGEIYRIFKGECQSVASLNYRNHLAQETIHHGCVSTCENRANIDGRSVKEKAEKCIEQECGPAPKELEPTPCVEDYRKDSPECENCNSIEASQTRWKTCVQIALNRNGKTEEIDELCGPLRLASRDQFALPQEVKDTIGYFDDPKTGTAFLLDRYVRDGSGGPYWDQIKVAAKKAFGKELKD